VAIKLIPINPSIDVQSQMRAFKQDIVTLKKTRHDNIVLFMGACMKPLAIVTKYVGTQSICYMLYIECDGICQWVLIFLYTVGSCLRLYIGMTTDI